MPSNKVRVSIRLKAVPKAAPYVATAAFTSRPTTHGKSSRVTFYALSALAIVAISIGSFIVISLLNQQQYKPISYGETVTGTADSASGDEWYFNGTKGNLVSLRLTSTGGNMQLFVNNDAKDISQIVFNTGCTIDGVKNTNNCGLNNLALPVTGKYDISVTNNNYPPNGIPYTLTLTKDN